MESYSILNGAQSLKPRAPNPLIKFIDQLFRQEVDQVRPFSELGVISDHTGKFYPNSLASSSSIRSTSGDYLNLERGLLSEHRLWYSNSVAIILTNELNRTLEICSAIHAQSQNPRPPETLIDFLYRLFLKEAGPFLRFDVPAIFNKTRKDFLNSLASSHIQSTPNGCVDVFSTLLHQCYSNSFPYQLEGKFTKNLATEHYSSTIERCVSLVSETVSLILPLEFILNSFSLMAGNKRICSFGDAKGLVLNFLEVLRPNHLRNIQWGFGGDFEPSGIDVSADSEGSDSYAVVILQNSTESGEHKLAQDSLDDLNENVTCNGFNLEPDILQNAIKVPICEYYLFSPSQMMEKQKEVTSGTTSAGPSGSGSSSRNSSLKSTKSSSDETEKGDDHTSSSKDEEENDGSSSSSEYLYLDNRPVPVVPVIPVIPLFERAVDGTLIQRALLPTNALRGYGCLARLVRLFSPYDPPESLVHILWPWANHTTVYFGEDDRVLNPRARWEDFQPKLKEVHMFPIEVGRPALAYLPAVPLHVPGLPSLDVRPYYWFRFQQPSMPERVLVIRRSAMHSYRRFFWLINGLWASWYGGEPLNTEKITEANAVQAGYNFVLPRSDRIKFFDEDGKELKLPTFLFARNGLEEHWRFRWRLENSLEEMDNRDTTLDESSDEDEKRYDYYPDDINYESIWDFLTQVLQVVITRST